MSISAVFSIILGIVKAIPIFQKWLEQFMQFYAQKQIEAHQKEFVQALAALLLDSNQIPLEEAIGSDNAGKPAMRRDGVRERARKAVEENEKTDNDPNPAA